MLEFFWHISIHQLAQSLCFLRLFLLLCLRALFEGETVTVSYFNWRLADKYLWSNCGLLVSLVHCVIYQCSSQGNQWFFCILWPLLGGFAFRSLCWLIKCETLHHTNYPGFLDLAELLECGYLTWVSLLTCCSDFIYFFSILKKQLHHIICTIGIDITCHTIYSNGNDLF